MIVVFLTHNYPRFPGDLPGSFLHPLALALQRRGHDVRVVAPSDRGRGGREPLDGIPVHRVRYASAAAESLAYSGAMQQALKSPAGWRALWGLVRAMRAGVRAEFEGMPSGAAGVVHAHWWFPAGFAVPRGYASVVTMHGTDGRILSRNAITRSVGGRVLRRAGVVTAVSPELARVAKAASGRTGVISHVQPMPVETTGWPWSEETSPRLVVVGRLTPQKRIHLAIRAAGIAARREPLSLTIIGEGPERVALEQESMGQPGLAVRFLGARSSSEVVTELAGAGALLFPAEQEGFGLAAIEALMLGVPVLACTDGGGIVSALARFGGGSTVEPSAEALAEGLGRAMVPAIREQARLAGERWREELAPDRVAQRFEGWYAEALAR